MGDKMLSRNWDSFRRKQKDVKNYTRWYDHMQTTGVNDVYERYLASQRLKCFWCTGRVYRGNKDFFFLEGNGPFNSRSSWDLHYLCFTYSDMDSHLNFVCQNGKQCISVYGLVDDMHILILGDLKGCVVPASKVVV